MPCYTYNLKALISFKMAYSLSYNQKLEFSRFTSNNYNIGHWSNVDMENR